MLHCRRNPRIRLTAPEATKITMLLIMFMATWTESKLDKLPVVSSILLVSLKTERFTLGVLERMEPLDMAIGIK